ncbi:MAG: hypothetical protein Q7S27_00090 [Nanoarchaeota archaeon]|nr:hypothetical protein [Nanoarchaeota archaeon]
MNRRDFQKAILTGGLITIFGCGGGGGGGKKKNKAPVIESIVRGFKNTNGEYDGKIHYNIIAKDRDGEIKEVCVKWNNEDLKCYDDPIVEFSGKIDEGVNTLKATAYDNMGKASSTLLDGFNAHIPSYTEAYNHIREMIEADIRTGEPIRLKDASSSDEQKYADFPGKVVIALDDLLVPSDFKIIKNDGSIALINYSSAEENLEKHLSYRRALQDYRIDNLYFYATPLDEVHNAMGELISKYYETDF